MFTFFSQDLTTLNRKILGGRLLRNHFPVALTEELKQKLQHQHKSWARNKNSVEHVLLIPISHVR